MTYQHFKALRKMTGLLALGWAGLAATSISLEAQAILVSNTALSFKTGLGQDPAVQTLIVGSSGPVFTLQVVTTTTTGGSWLQYSSDSGITPANLKVTPQTSNLQAGTYQGQIQISAAGASNSPLTINVTVTVGSAATSALTAAPAVLNFSAQLNGNPPPVQAITVNSADPSVGFTVNVSTGGAGPQWLQVAPVSGNTPQVLNVSVSAQGLTGGSYIGTINIVPNSQGPAVNVIVNLSVNALPTLIVSPAGGFQFYFQAGTTAVPAPQGLTLSTASGTLSMGLQVATGNNLPWLAIGQTQAIVGTSPIQIPISISPIVSTFAPGVYLGSITITAPGATNPQIAISVSLQVSALPLISLGNFLQTFDFRAGLPPPPPQNVQIGVSSGQLPYSATPMLTPGLNWLTITPDTGTLPASFAVAVDATGLSTGTYSGQIRVDSPGAANSPLTFPVNLSVAANGLIVANPGQLAYNFQIGTANPVSQTLAVGTTGGTTHFDIQTLTNNCGLNWISVTPLSGIAPSSVQVSVSSAGMNVPGQCTGRIGIVNQTGVQTLVPISLKVSADPLLNVTPPIMTFTGPTAGALPVAQTIQLSSTDPNNQLFYSTAVSTVNGGSWLTLASNASGQTPATLPVVVNQGALAPGSYTGVVEVRPVGLAPVKVAVTMVVTSNISIGVSPPSISFVTVAGISPGPVVLTVSSLGGSLPFSANANSSTSWLNVTPTSGTTTGQLIVSANTLGLAPGAYTGSITISSFQASNPLLTVPVSLTVGQPQSLAVTPMTLSFSYLNGDPAPPSQTINLSPSSGTVDFKATAEVSGSVPWLKATPGAGTAPARITVTVDPTGLAPTLYSGTITILTAGLPPVVVPVSFSISGPPVPSLSSVLNAGSLLDGPIAPGEIVVLAGANTGPSGDPVVAQLNADGTLPLAIGDTQVLFDTLIAPILSVQTNQVTVIVPYELAGQPSTLIQVKRKSVYSNPLQIPITATVPGVFTANVPATKVGMIMNADGTPNSVDHPALANTTLTVYYTGDGQTDPPRTTNSVTPTGPPFPAPIQLLTATLGGTAASVTLYGPVPGKFAGLSTAAITVPSGLGPGPQPLFLISGSTPSQGGLMVYVSN